jgi:hypothetical protein
VVGAEVLVDGLFKKPEGDFGPYLIVAMSGAEFRPLAAFVDLDLVAVDLSASRLRALPEMAFYGCNQLAAVAFPLELEVIGPKCFVACDRLQVVDLAATQLKALGNGAFAACDVTRVSVPASLRDIGSLVFASTPLKILDLSACEGICIGDKPGRSLVEVALPRKGFAAAAKAFLLGSRVEVLRADVGEAEISALFPLLSGWGIDKLCVVSPRLGECEWQRPQESALHEVMDPVAVTVPVTMTITAWRKFPDEWLPFLRVIDLSGLAVERLPRGVTLEGLAWLERAVLPTVLRKLPMNFFRGCWRLKSIDTDYTALEEIGFCACEECTSLAAFAFPPTVRKIDGAFGGTSITRIDLANTAVESVSVWAMIFLVELTLPRCCVLDIQHIGSVSGIPHPFAP